MREKLTRKELVFVASMLFGMFFGAGNLIFPVYLGQLSGSHVWPAVIGFIITGVGLPLLGVTALGSAGRRGCSPEFPGGEGLWRLFHLRPVPDHRPLLRHPPLRHGLLHGGGRSPFSRGGTAPWPWGSFPWSFSPPCWPFPSGPARFSPGWEKFSTPSSSASLGFWWSGPCSLPWGPSGGGAHGRLRHRRLLHRLPGGLPDHGRPGQPSLRHRGGQRHPGSGGEKSDAVAKNTILPVCSAACSWPSST